MKFSRRTLLFSVLAGALALRANVVLAQPAGPTSVPGVSTWLGEWKDAKRANRSVPVKIYYPEKAGKYPVIIFSHGLGGSREGYWYLGDYWAQHGYISVHLQHIGSDSAVWQGGDRQELFRAANVQNSLDRAYDVSFALDQLTALNKDAAFPLHGELDLDYIGMAGHSFGANTTLLISGMRYPGGAYRLADPRVKASIAMSSPMPVASNFAAIYGGIKIPMYHLTGTKDSTPFDAPNRTAADRRLPFDHTNGADSYLTIFDGGDHMLFSGVRTRGEANLPSDPHNHLLIQESTTKFWDAYLKGDTKAKSWLQSDFAKELGTAGTFEKRVNG